MVLCSILHYFLLWLLYFCFDSMQGQQMFP